MVLVFLTFQLIGVFYPLQWGDAGVKRLSFQNQSNSSPQKTLETTKNLNCKQFLQTMNIPTKAIHLAKSLIIYTVYMSLKA